MCASRVAHSPSSDRARGRCLERSPRRRRTISSTATYAMHSQHQPPAPRRPPAFRLLTRYIHSRVRFSCVRRRTAPTARRRRRKGAQRATDSWPQTARAGSGEWRGREIFHIQIQYHIAASTSSATRPSEPSADKEFRAVRWGMRLACASRPRSRHSGSALPSAPKCGIRIRDSGVGGHLSRVCAAARENGPAASSS